jgi:hypothetical protein
VVQQQDNAARKINQPELEYHLKSSLKAPSLAVNVAFKV